MIIQYGVMFASVDTAIDIYDLPGVTSVADQTFRPWRVVPNGTAARPVPGALLIWDEGGVCLSLPYSRVSPS